METHKKQLSLFSLKRGADALRHEDANSDWKPLGEPARLVKTENFEFRRYQLKIMESIYSGENALVIVPTGKGKTIMSILSAAKPVSKGEKVLYVAATRPLVEQHHKEVSDAFVDKQGIEMLTGQTKTGERTRILKDAKIIIATPETALNELKRGNMPLDGFGMLIIDECQRAVGNYAYTHLAKSFKEMDRQLVCFTGSLGSKTSVANNIIETLGISNIQVRNWQDSDIRPYMVKVGVKTVMVEKSETMVAIEKHLKKFIDENFNSMKRAGLVGKGANFENMPRSEFMAIRPVTGMLMDKVLKRELGLEERETAVAGVKGFYKLMYVSHAYDLVETQGFRPALDNLKKLAAKKTTNKSLREMFNNERIKATGRILKRALDSGEEHPKVNALINAVKENSGKRMIVFAHNRSTVDMLVEKLQEQGIAARPFMGKKDGITDKHQRQTIKDYSQSKFNVLVSTLIGEEGIDIKAEPNLVICYDAVPSAIRLVQRKGRTGRNMPGNVVMLITKDTKDEAYHEISAWREHSMEKLTDKLRGGTAVKNAEDKQTETKKESNSHINEQLVLFDTFRYPD